MTGSSTPCRCSSRRICCIVPKRRVSVSLKTALNLAQILISAVLILVLLLQAKGSGFGSALGAGSASVFRTRRGVERTLFQLTIVLIVVFVLISLLSVRVAR